MTKSLAPFQVSCPSCDAEYPVDPDRVPPGGVHAVCSACLRTFPVTVPEDAWAAPSASPPQAGPESEPGDAAWDELSDTSEPVVPPTPAPKAKTETDAGVPSDVGDKSETSTAFVWEGAAQAAPDEAAAGVEESIGKEEEDDSLQDLSNLASEALQEADEEVDEPSERASLSLGAARFGRRDPHDRAKRLARVLVSDIIAYYPEKHSEAVLRGSVKEDFADEVEKSRKEYVDQVGQEMADSTPYFREALNEVLARGSEVY
ncbi:MAG: zinc-ribbon domain-containing protein [Gemmatimonadota bacterium]